MTSGTATEVARVATCTERGVRPSNQDALCAKVATTAWGEVSMAIVCDGVGGLSWGELASSSVVRLFSEWFERDLPDWLGGHVLGGGIGLLGLRGVWEHLLGRANVELLSYGARHGGALGTTFTGVVCLDGRYLVGHVGDCRAYLVGADATRRLTEDQTLAQREAALGRMDERQALRSPHRSVLLQAVGSQGTLRPVFHQGHYQPGDLFVLASDGAWHLQGDDGIDRCFRPRRQAGEEALVQACEGVIAADLAGGERDNLTVVCLGPEWPVASDDDAAEDTAALLGRDGA